MIGATFSAFHVPGTSWNIYDPLANIAAAINYARARYGPTLMSGGMGMGSGHGYATGGLVREPVIGFGTVTGQRYTFGEAGPEWVTPATGPGGPAIVIGHVSLPDGTGIAKMLTELSFWLAAAQQANYAGVLPGS